MKTKKLDTPELLILGSVAMDDIETPFGKHKELLGGSGTYASYCSSYFTNTGIVSIVGEDFPKKYWDLFAKRGIDTKGIQVSGKTFRWQGFYEYDMEVAKTLCTELNCLESFNPVLPDSYKKAKYAFLGNSHPYQQLQVIQQLEDPKIIAMDTMNLWIHHTKDALIDVIKKVNILLLNEGEARELFHNVNLVQAAKKALQLGPEYVIIKKGENGAIMFSNSAHFSAPAYPLETVKDPTGCGDCFGGGLMGYVAAHGDKGLKEEILRKAIVYGSVFASYNAEEFSLNKLKETKKRDIEKRYKEFKKIRNF